MDERTGEAFELGEQLTVIGRRLQTGDPAPEFTLDFLNGEGAITTVRLGDSHGESRLLNVINSIDTPVCQVETRSWQERVPADKTARVLTISMDLPFALDRWREGEGPAHQLLSSHRSEQFGRDYGVLIKEWRLLQRAVFVIDGAGKITHAEYVADQMTEPDYGAAIAALG